MDHSKTAATPTETKTASPASGAEHIGSSSETNLLPMGQMGSGTSWTPITTPQHMIHKQSGDWLLMLHYNAIVGVNSQGGPRGVTKFESANWIMPMAFRKLG